MFTVKIIVLFVLLSVGIFVNLDNHYFVYGADNNKSDKDNSDSNSDDNDNKSDKDNSDSNSDDNDNKSDKDNSDSNSDDNDNKSDKDSSSIPFILPFP
ncbi:MAG: hypothetical protein DA328_05585 [Nitrososphaeraceae archaeon]|nr:hypothetical protein [Nitrososphaeraceae archaeon]